ncbi:eukaryotic membrane protein family [Seiridium cupressi]
MPGIVTEEAQGGPPIGIRQYEERTGRSLSRDDGRLEERTETKQLPSPQPSPRADPFPDLEITASTPIIPLDVADDARPDGPLVDVKEGAASQQGIRNTKESTSSSTESSNHSSDEASSTSPEEEPHAQASPRKASDACDKAKTSSTIKRDTSGTVRKLSASQMQALTTSPESLPIAVVPPQSPVGSQRKPNGMDYPLSAGVVESANRPSMNEQVQNGIGLGIQNPANGVAKATSTAKTFSDPLRSRNFSENPLATRTAPETKRPSAGPRTLSQPPISRRPTVGSANVTSPTNSRRFSFNPAARPPPLNLGASSNIMPAPRRTTPVPRRTDKTPSEELESADPLQTAAIQPTIPLPPMSLHTHLQLELAGVRPSPLYIYRHQTSDIPYESSAVKFERLLNALLLPPLLESTLMFGTLACLDAFLYTFTLLPLRFFIAAWVLVKWWGYVVWKEAKWLTGFVWQGTWRLWQRGRRGRTATRPSNRTESSQTTAGEVERSQSRAREAGYASDATSASLDAGRLNGNSGFHPPKHAMPRHKPGGFRHRRTKSMPSDLTQYHKADLLQGAVIVCSSLALMTIDASRMYHFVRAQSAMKLYVIFNLLEVGDRLLAAIGQDILECLFSTETLSRNSFGRSKVLLPLGMFILSLIYNVAHAVVLFYQVITLNVAVNSYSNALLSLLMSNQFVEIKGSVFKKIEKENLFQLTCSDVVERFQLWIILIIIGMRNIVEVGGLSIPGAGSEVDPSMSGPGPIHTASNLPASFTLLPSWIFSGEVLSPFLIVIGSEMLVDWIKHAYVNKFNNVKPTVYRRMLDIFCKDYYTNAFGAPALTRRIGLPLLPLSCLFIRASVQIYHMFLATHLPPPMPTATTELSLESSVPSSAAMLAALDRLDNLLRNALGRAVYGNPFTPPEGRSYWSFTSDDAVALITMLTVFFLAWLVLLLVKLLLGMLLLKYARERYASIREQEQAIANGEQKRESFFQPGKRVGGWGQVEVGDERRKLIYADDPEGLSRMRDREKKGEQAGKKMEIGDDGLEKVTRYEMIAKRIW